MAWKQDLAKLKQQLEPEPTTAAPKALPKPAPKPTGPVRLDDEDAVFLSAMGLKSAPARVTAPAEPALPVEPVAPTEAKAPETFLDAVKDLKGLKPMVKGLPERSTAPAKPAVAQAPPPVVLPIPPVGPVDPIPKPAELEAQAAPLQPSRFQLAAGMAIEVDGSLDLRGHSLADALERLKDRLGDGQVLGWRSLQVTLGTDPALHEGLMDLLSSGQVPMVARYAQAPVPMGGTQAWLLYFAPPSNQA